MKPEIYCSKCEKYKECKYVSEIKKNYPDPANIKPIVIYGSCPSYSPKRNK